MPTDTSPAMPQLDDRYATGTTPEGEQGLVPGVAPITLRDRLAFRMAALITPKRNPDARQKPCDIGLFDLSARDQCDLIDLLRALERDALTPDHR